MINNRTIHQLALGLGLAAVVSASATAAEAGWYFGLSGGQSTFDIDQEALDEVVELSFFEIGAPVISGSSSLDDRGTSLGLFGGYRFSPYFAVEAGYVDLGTAEYRSSGNVNPPGPVTSVPAVFSMDFETKGITVSGVGSLPIGEMFDVHARLGILFADSEIGLAATVGSGSGSGSASDSLSASSQEMLYGIGAAMHFGENWSVSLDWQRYVDVGDEDETDEADIDSLALSVIFRL